MNLTLSAQAMFAGTYQQTFLDTATEDSLLELAKVFDIISLESVFTTIILRIGTHTGTRLEKQHLPQCLVFILCITRQPSQGSSLKLGLRSW